MKAEKAGEYAFLVCIIVAILAGLASPFIATPGYVTALLVVLGVIIGLTTITEKETTPFLVAAVALVVSATVKFSVIPLVGSVIDAIVANIAAFTAPAAVIVAIKAVYALASKK